MRNTLEDVHNILMEQLERLNDDELDEVNLEKEIKRSVAMTNIATSIAENANTVIKATKLQYEMGAGTLDVNGYLLGSRPK